MKVSRSTLIDLPPEIVWSEVQTARLLFHIAWPLVRFIPVAANRSNISSRVAVSGQTEAARDIAVRHAMDCNLDARTGSGDWPKRLRDNGYSALITQWDHWIVISPDGKGGTHYSDDVEISAGLITPFIWAFAQVFYWHRQRRWRGLARSLQARKVIAEEMEIFSQAKASGDTAKAWSALERAHIVSQPYLGPHLSSHWAMLLFAISQRDAREIAGQIFRLALAPLGAISGRIPTGNTGRANVSAFQQMDIPPDLRAKLRGETE